METTVPRKRSYPKSVSAATRALIERICTMRGSQIRREHEAHKRPPRGAPKKRRNARVQSHRD